MTARHRAAAAAAVAAALAAGGCGYTFGSGLPERGIRTVFVEVAGNETWRQRLEVDLSVAVSRELTASSDLVPTTRDRADAVLQIVLGQEHERTLVAGSRTDPVLEGAEEAVVHVRLVRRDGRAIVDREILERAEFRDPIGENLVSARSELVRDLARKIALALEAGF